MHDGVIESVGETDALGDAPTERDAVGEGVGELEELGVIEGVGVALGTAGCGAMPRKALGAEALTLVVSSAPAEAVFASTE